jgi:hypothetical protein
MIFIIFDFGIDGVPPSAGSPNLYMNEYSFIYQRRSSPVKLNSNLAKNALDSAYSIEYQIAFGMRDRIHCRDSATQKRR